MRKTRTYTNIEKQQILDEVKDVGNMAAVASKNNIPISTIHAWVHKEKIIPSSKKHKPNKELKAAKTRIGDLELENKILKELLKKTYQIWDTD